MPTHPPMVSVLVPCFQSAAYVRRALDSIRAQSFADWEAIAVDNGSTDNTWAIVSEYAALDSRIRVYRNDSNIGPVLNWRRCADKATGHFACLLFSDDWYEQDYLSTAVQSVASDPGIGAFYSAVRRHRLSKTGEWEGSTVEYCHKNDQVVESVDFLRSLMERRGPSVPLSPACALMRRTDITRWLGYQFTHEGSNNFLVHGAGPDVALYVQACAEYPRLGHSPRPLVNFLAHSSNLSGRSEVRAAYGIAIYELFEKVIRDGRVHGEAVRAFCGLRIGLGGRATQAVGAFGLREWLEVVRITIRHALMRIELLRNGRRFARGS